MEHGHGSGAFPPYPDSVAHSVAQPVWVTQLLQGQAVVMGAIYTLLTEVRAIMATISEVQTELATVQASVVDLRAQIDAEQADIQTLLDAATTANAGLQAQIDALTAQVANGGTPEQLQAILDGLVEIQTGIVAAKDDVASTV